uniref:RING-type domain-containing protein n=1 Tax=Salix viminalis TaxID=40686 RepID=A0A6N2LL55_SALVM
MASLSELFSHLYTMTILFVSFLVVEIVILFQSVIGSNLTSDEPIISTTQYLKHIEEKNPTISFSEKLTRQQDSVECAICLAKYSEGEGVRKLNCKHTFHKDCLDKWLQKCLATCPLCRAKVLPDEIVAKYDRMQNKIRYGNGLQRIS